MSSAMTEHTLSIETSKKLYAVAFSANGEYLLSGDEVWRVKDSKRIAMMEAPASGNGVQCLAVSKDGIHIAGGTCWGEVCVWDAKTFKTAWQAQTEEDDTHAVDFSVDSAKLVSGSGYTASIWDVGMGEQVNTLEHTELVIAAKYSPDGDRIATATPDFVYLWDSTDGRLLFTIPVRVLPLHNRGLVWFKTTIFVVSGDKINQFSTLKPEAGGPASISQWPVSKINWALSIAVPKHGKFIAYSTRSAVTLSDRLTRSQLGYIKRKLTECAIMLSPDDESLAIAEQSGKISIIRLSRDILSPQASYPALQDIELPLNRTVLNAWKTNQLDDAETAATNIMLESQLPDYNLLAARALIRARLRHSDEAFIDANTAIILQPSVIAYVAWSLAYLGKGEKDKAYWACDIAFEHFHSTHFTLLLVIKAIIVFMAGEHLSAVSRMDDLIATVHSDSSLCMVQAYMQLLMGDTYVECGKYNDAIHSFERASAQVKGDRHPPPTVISLASIAVLVRRLKVTYSRLWWQITGWTFEGLHITVRQRLCEALWAAGCQTGAGKSVLELVNTYDEVYVCKSVMKWASQFIAQFFSAPGVFHRQAGDNDTPAHHATVNATVTPLLRAWARATLTHDLWQNVSTSAANFLVSRFAIFQIICECLEEDDRTMDAVACLNSMLAELVDQENLSDHEVRWLNKFKRRCAQSLEDLGDAAMSDGQYDGAISQYSVALSLQPPAPQGLLVKRGKVYLAQGLWPEALSDAKKVIDIDPSSPWGYERQHAALHLGGYYPGALHAFEAMLAMILQSPDEGIRALRGNYISPADTRDAIKRVVRDTLCDSPHVLINTRSGQLAGKTEQAASFESLPTFIMLVSSMTTHIDIIRIEQEVQKYYRYAMFSHKWADNEPLFEQVMRVVVHDLEDSPTHNKLKMFCKIVQNAGFQWAWSDTCCINKADHFVLQEALVCMFKWYQNSAMTVVFLCDALFPSRRGDLMKSIWNSRAWTFQEYHASKVVRFYTKDWQPYLNLDIPNHKESPEIISEMEESTGISARALMAIQPGFGDVREKLCLASTRNTTLVEDAAYSLLGIFSMSLPVVYGEGDHALGRLLAQVLTSSGDTSILAWAGKCGSFNSCLPTRINVYKGLIPLHIPSAVGPAELEKTIATFRTSPVNPALVMQLYDQLQDLPLPFFVGQRLKLPGLIFKLGTVSRNAGARVYRAQTDALGIVEIETDEALPRFSPLYLVHPWIDFLLDRHPVGKVAEAIPEESSDGQSVLLGERSPSTTPSTILAVPLKKRLSLFAPRFSLPFGGLIVPRAKDAGSLLPPSTVSQQDKRKLAFQMLARLKQPFGALLLAQNSGKVMAHKRLAAQTLITVKLEEVTPAVLNRLVSSVRVLDVL